VRALQAARGTPLTGNNSLVTETGEPGAPAPSGRPAGRSVVILVLVIAVVVLAADIITKVIVVAKLSGRPDVHVIGNFLQLTETRNPGAAFSIGGPSTTVFFTAIAVGVVVFILRTSHQIRSLGWAVTLGLLLGGATGNLTDRLFRWPGPFRGWVVDWIQIPHWPVFNIADSAIVCGGVLAVILALRNVRVDGTRPVRASGHAAEPDDRAGPGPAAGSSEDPAGGGDA